MIVLRVILIILSVCLLNCSEQTDKTAAPQGETVVPGAADNTLLPKSPETDIDIAIGPADATVQSIITLRSNKAGINMSDIQWYISGVRDETSKGLRLITDEIKKGDVVQAVIVDRNKEYRSNEITIGNSAPVILKAALLPAVPRVSSTLTVDLKADDADKDKISFKYQWTLNDKFAGENNYLQTELKRDDIINVEVTPYDGESYGKSIKLKSRVFNSLPVVSQSKPVFNGKIYQYQIAASDPDGDTLTYKLEQGPKGMAIDPATGIITWEVPPDDKGAHESKVSVSDNNGGAIIVPFTTRIKFEENKATK